MIEKLQHTPNINTSQFKYRFHTTDGAHYLFTLKETINTTAFNDIKFNYLYGKESTFLTVE